MKEIKLLLESQGPDPSEEVVTGFLNNQEIDMLKVFAQKIIRVRNSTILQRGLPAITDMGWNAENGIRFACPPVSNSELYELLHVLRPLILQKEVCSFQKISGIIGSKFDHPTIRMELKRIRKFFQDGELSFYMQIRIGDKPLFADETLKLWLNSEEYHTDIDKSAEWKALEERLTTENSRALIISQIQSKVKALFRLDFFVRLVINDPVTP